MAGGLRKELQTCRLGIVYLWMCATEVARHHAPRCCWWPEISGESTQSFIAVARRRTAKLYLL